MLRQVFVTAVLATSLAFFALATGPAPGQIKNLVTFGDSYTTDGFNISAGVESPVPGFVSDYQQFL